MKKRENKDESGRERERDRNTPKEIKYNNRMGFFLFFFVSFVSGVKNKKKSSLQLVIIDR